MIALILLSVTSTALAGKEFQRTSCLQTSRIDIVRVISILASSTLDRPTKALDI
jgi:hypothetical protein